MGDQMILQSPSTPGTVPNLVNSISSSKHNKNDGNIFGQSNGTNIEL